MTTIRDRLRHLGQVAKAEFPHILAQSPVILPDRLRLHFIDGSWMEIRYPVLTKYSFHWQRGSEIIRINTAPHHQHRVRTTFPRHIHYQTETNVVDDHLTQLTNTPSENLRNVLKWVENQLD